MQRKKWTRNCLAMAALLILPILGVSCAAATKNVEDFRYNEIIEPAPALMPELVDGSPRECKECTAVNGQPTFLITGRDFVAIKRKIIELDNYIEQLKDVMRAHGVID